MQIKRDLFTQPDWPYISIYQDLGLLREEFHKIGRFDDSNAKLDEVVKLFATYLAVKLGDINDFSTPTGQISSLSIDRLQKAFKNAAELPYFQRNDGVSIFGPAAQLALRESDAELTRRLVKLVINAVDNAFRHQELGSPYDILNEAFGHFVRDNFRSNIEDAQYLTPAEVVDFMVDIAVMEMGRTTDRNGSDSFIVADPCCGVGSFLAAFAAKYRSLAGSSSRKLCLHAQDKVERMVRLTTINLTLFKVFEHSVTIGNSLYTGSPLDKLNGQVDLILTNPPFGARFSPQEVSSMAGDNTPFFSTIGQTRALIESELLFIDRNLKLLREGGNLLIVVPDGVVSANGLPALLRHYLRSTATLRGITELPSVTFAQAGTRTKTAVLHLQKGTTPKVGRSSVFMAVTTDLGFQVCSRKGVPIRVDKGVNELPVLVKAYEEYAASGTIHNATVLSHTPSAVNIPIEVLDSSWTPSHYQTKRLHMIKALHKSNGIYQIRLADLVTFASDNRKQERHRPGTKFISVLHVISEGVLDLKGIEDYAPITPGVSVYPGEILLSRINPRIPRVLVAPNLVERMLCSSEFEIMVPQSDVDPYMVAFLLLSEPVQSQIQSLTSGTSASHNRIKTRHLAQVVLPIPLSGTKSASSLKQIVNDYKCTLNELHKNTERLLSLREREMDWL